VCVFVAENASYSTENDKCDAYGLGTATHRYNTI